MEPSKEPISVRNSRINAQILGKLGSKETSSLICREGLLDALQVLYDECNTECLKSCDKNIQTFVDKHRKTLNELKQSRVNLFDFEVKNVIGRGHFGEVHVVKEKQTGDVYAMKTLKKYQTLQQKRASFEEERNIMAFSNSAWLTCLQYAFQDSTNLYFIMEYHPGGDLLGLLYRQGGTLPESAASFYIAELALGLNDLHNMGYVHLDVKPDNVLLDRCGHLKLADFGSATKLDQKGLIMDVLPIGTPDYIAPELLQSLDNKFKKTTYGVSCDYWSLGILAYELTIGNTPFNGPNTTSTYSKIINHTTNLKFPPDVLLSQAYVSLIKGLLTEQNSRFTHDDILKHSLYRNVDFNNLRDQVPPYVPKITSVDDTSNFVDIERKKSEPHIDNFKTKTQFSGKNLPFLGFTYVQNSHKDYRDSFAAKVPHDTSVENLKKEVDKLRRELAMNEDSFQERGGLERKLEEKVRRLKSVEDLRDRLERDLANSIAECCVLKRTLDLERKDRADLERKALELIKSTKLKWELSEKTKFDSLIKKNQEMQNEVTKLLDENQILREELERVAKSENNHKISLENVENLSRRSVLSLESTLDKVTTQTQNQLTQMQSQLNDEVQEKSVLLKKISEMKLEEGALNDNLRRINEKYAQLLTKFEEAQQIISRDKAKIAKLGERDGVLTKYEDEIRKLKDTIDLLKNNEKHFVNIDNELKKEKDLNENLSTEIEDLKSEIVFEKLSHDTIIEDLKTNHQTAIKNFEDKIKDYLDQINEHEIQRKEACLNDQINESKVQTLENLLVKLESGVAKLESPVERETILQEQINRLEQQLAQVHETLAVERQDLHQIKSKYWRMEKDLKNAELDKKIVERDLIESRSANNHLTVEMKSLQTKLSQTKNIHESALVELSTLNETLSNDILKHKHLVKNLENKLTYEAEKSVKNVNAIDDLITKMCNKETEMLAFVKELETCKMQKTDVELQLANHEKNYAKLIDEFERILREKSDLLNEIENYKRERHNNQLNRNALREACTTLEAQLQEFEKLYALSESKRQSLKSEVDELTSDLMKAKHETLEAKQLMNEEKTMKLLAETKYKKLHGDLESVQSECEGYKKQYVDFKHFSSSLADELNTNEQKITDLEINLQACERQIDNYVTKNNRLKEENSTRLTYVNNLKESNYKLNQNLNAIKGENESLVDHIEKMENTFSEQMNYYTQRELKLEATVQQQTKLIDFLQSKVEESNKKKKTLSDKIFGSSKKENQPPISIVLNYKDLELQLNREKETTKGLRKEIISLKSQLYVKPGIEMDNAQHVNVSEHAKVLEQIVQSPASQKNDLYRQNSMQRMHHNIPHRFESKLCTKNAKCGHCKNPMLLGRHISACRECLIVVHTTCIGELPRTCGLPQAYAKHYSESVNKLHNLKLEPEAVKPKDELFDVEGWVKIPVKSCWEKCYACLTASMLSFYKEPPNQSKAEPVEYLDLKPPDGHGKVILEPTSSEIDTPVARSDLPFVIKVEVSPNTTCWPPKCLIFMTLGNEDKEKWYKALENIFRGNVEKYNGDSILAIDDIEPNCLIDLKEVYLLGTEQGLYSYNKSSLVHISGPLHVHQISIILKLKIVLMIVDASRVFISCNLNHLINLSMCAPCSKPTLQFKVVNVKNMNGFHIFQTSSIANRHTLCIATARQLIIMSHDDNTNDFIPERILDTAEPTSCILFTEHSLIIGADKFFEIDLTSYNADEFLDISDLKLSHAIKCYKMKSFPLAILQISKNPIEFLLCFHEFATFVDEFGRSSRLDDIKWSRLPSAFHYHNNYLYVVQFAAVEIFKITPNTCNVEQSDASANIGGFKIEMNTVKYLGCTKDGIYVANSSDIKVIRGAMLDFDEVSLASGTTERGDESDVDVSDRFSFTSSIVRSLDGNLSDTESVATDGDNLEAQRRVKFACTTDL